MPVSYPKNPSNIGEHLKKKRMDSKLLQKDVAKIFGVTEDCITNWEKNRNIPQIHFFPKIINFLGYLPFDTDLTTFSAKLIAYRHISGLSQKRLGKILKVDGGTICSWELGENHPKKGTIDKLNLLWEKENVTIAHKAATR